MHRQNIGIGLLGWVRAGAFEQDELLAIVGAQGAHCVIQLLKAGHAGREQNWDSGFSRRFNQWNMDELEGRNLYGVDSNGKQEVDGLSVKRRTYAGETLGASR